MNSDLADFRLQIRAWIRENAPEGLAELADWSVVASLGGSTRGPTKEQKDHPLCQEWDRRLRAANLICPQWPKQYGGSDFSRLQLTIFAEECFRAGVPRIDRGHGETMVGPAILAHGTQEQKDHFIPRIIANEDRYCQGFSEPGAGSDLAGLQTRADIDGDELVIEGQKTWTSRADSATMVYCLVRTNRDVSKHRGITFVIVPMADNNIEIRSIKQMSGGGEFFETFLDGARAPLFNVVGGIDQGWSVAMTTLANERGGDRTMLRHLALTREFNALLDASRKAGSSTDPLVRQKLAWAYTNIELIRYAGLRYAASMIDERAVGPNASVTKILWTEYHRRFGDLALDVLGAPGLLCEYGDGETTKTDQWGDTFLASRAGTIYSGTNEIQRRIIAERALGLPKG